MLTNIRGLVDRLDLRPSRGAMPLFEAVSNAIDAIGERAIGMSQGNIRVRLVHAQDLAHQAGDVTPAIDGIDVSDNGIGFHDVHLKSFEEAYTLAKVGMGGRGVGRFTFLKVFSDVSVRSVFEREGSCNVDSGRVWFNLELSKKSPQCLEYIVVHELVHLLERHHNDRFTDLTNRFMPHWRLYREELNTAPLAHETWNY